MSDHTVNTPKRGPWKARAATIGVVLTAALLGGATAAYADSWELSGPNRGSRAAAEADIPA